MKKTLSVIVVFLLVFTMAFSAFALEIGKYLSTSAQTSTLTAVEFTTSNAKIIGRTNPAYPFLIGHHSSGVEFTVTQVEEHHIARVHAKILPKETEEEE